MLIGDDGANIKISREHNELNHDGIKTYLNSHYVRSLKAMARIFSVPLHGISHNIVRLAIHLPDNQTMYYVENQEVQAIIIKRGQCITLTEHFAEIAKPSSTSRNIFYKDFPEQFV